MAQEAKGIRYQLQLAADAKDSLKSRMRENRKYGSEEGRRQQCRPPTQQNEKKTAEKQAETVTISRAEYEELKLQNQWLLEQLGLAKKRQFGSSSEKMHEEFMD